MARFTIYNPTTGEVVAQANSFGSAEKRCGDDLVFDDTCPHGTAYELCTKSACNNWERFTMSTDDNVHSKACMARAMISAVENFRDAEDYTTVDLQSANIGEEAGMYLLTMAQDMCQCHVWPISDVKGVYAVYGPHDAKRSAERWLYADRITLMDFTKLMGWIDRSARADARHS